MEKRIKLQEVHVRRMKLDYQRKIQCLNDVIKQQENIIEKLQKEKYPSQENSTRRIVQTTNDTNLGTCNTETKNS